MTARLRHINLLSWKDGTTQAAVDELRGELQRMADAIPDVRTLSYGPDLGLMDGNADFVITEEFDDADAFRRYLAHPAHERMVRDFLRPILASRHAIQFTAAGPRPGRPG
jgi:stress responsive alpha/beta barrel protein